jgi:hypothetical protein
MERARGEAADARPPYVSFVPERPAPDVVLPLAGVDAVPQDVLVFWEDERADRHKRVVAAIVGNALKLIKITVGFENALQVICEAPLDDSPATVPPQFITRGALLMWAEPAARGGRGGGKTIVVRIGRRLKMIRVIGDEDAPAIEVLDTIDLGG